MNAPSIWITGGGTGIGKAMALEYTKRGYRVAISGRRKDRLDEVKKEIEALGGTCLSVVCDVVDVDSIQKALEEIDREWGRIDIVVANAGFSMSARIETLTFEDWRRQLDVNVIGLAQTARYALPYLEKTKGRVVLISSVMAYMRYEKSGAYSASKAAVTAIGETLSLELLGTPVTSTVIHPGYVESEIGQVQTDGKFDPNAKDRRPSKMLWPADKAARVMANAIEKRKRIYTFTGHGIFAQFMCRHFPDFTFWIVGSNLRKRSREINIHRS